MHIAPVFPIIISSLICYFAVYSSNPVIRPIKRDEITELQAPYLTEEKAEEILAAYRVDGWKDMFTGEKSKKTGKEEATENQFDANELFGVYRMNERQKAIVRTVGQFRALSRLHIERMFFYATKNSKNNANAALNKLVSRGYLTANRNFQPYVYHAADTRLKKQGQKVSQYLDIADTFLSMQQYGDIKYFDVEPRLKVEGGEVRPDLYCRWKGNLWAVECQNSCFLEKQIDEKVKRYEFLFLSGGYESLPYQQENKKVMPIVLIIGEGVPYTLQSKHIRIIQAKNIDEFMKQFKTQVRPQLIRTGESGGIKIG